MGGVDRCDQNVATYRVGIRSKKWWWSPFVHLLDVAVNNAWLLHKSQEFVDKVDFLQFRRYIVQSYLKSCKIPISRPGPSKHTKADKRVTDAVRYDQIGHWIEVFMQKHFKI